MRAPRRHRTAIRRVGAINVAQLRSAAHAHYTGSPEHKGGPSFAGQPRPRADASICDGSLLDKQVLLTKWLRQSIRDGLVSEYWEGSFPRYVWFRQGDTVFEARLINREQGHYKGYPLNRDEWPEGV